MLSKQVTYTTAYHKQAEVSDHGLLVYSRLNPEEKREVFEFLCQLPKPSGMPRLQAADLANPLVFGKMDWKPELSMVLWVNHQPSWSNDTRELKVTPRHRHHIWPWRYKESSHAE